MTRRVKIGEAKTHLSALLADVEAGEDLVVSGPRPAARPGALSGTAPHSEPHVQPDPDLVLHRAGPGSTAVEGTCTCCSHQIRGL